MLNSSPSCRSILGFFTRYFRMRQLYTGLFVLVLAMVLMGAGRDAWSQEYDVTWTDLVGVTANGNTITKTTTAYEWDSGAVSVTTFGGNGGVDFTVSDLYKYVMCGLTDENVDAGYTSIDYAIYPYKGTLYVFENGVSRGTFGSYQIGDRFRVEREGSTVIYKHNSITFYTSSVASNGTLMVDGSMRHTGAAIVDAKIISVTPSVPDAVTDLNFLNNIDGEVELSWSEPANNGAAITEYEVQYGTVASGNFNFVYSDDNQPGATITGLTNGEQYQFRVVAKNTYGTSGFSNIITVTPIVGFDVTWTDLVGVTANGNTITKTTTAYEWDSGAVSVTTFGGDGGVDFTVSDLYKYVMCGLTDENVDAGYTSIDYAIYPYKGTLYVFENGVSRGTFGSYQIGDRFRVEREGSTVIYKHNSITFYTSSVASNGTLMVDGSMRHTGAAIVDARLFGVVLGVPGPINDLAAQPAYKKATLSWSAPANNGAPIISYSVQYGTVASGQFDHTINNIMEENVTVSELTPGVEYQFRVISENSYGTSGFSNVATAEIHLGTHVSGTISESQTWTLEESPYIIVGSTYFAEGVAELTIEPGVQVLFDGYYALTGVIYAEGTPGNPIVFTSNAENPQPGDWVRIELRRNSIVRNTVVEYADIGLYDAEPTYTPTLEYNLVRNNLEGLDFAQGYPIARYNTIVNNSYGIRLQGNMSSYPIGHYNLNLLYNNSAMNFRANVGAGIVVDAENNWWGTLDEYEIEDSIFDSNDLWVIHVVVDYVPYLGDPLTGDITKTTVDYLSYTGIANVEFNLGHVYKGGRNINGVFGQGWQ
ncbi:MAG: fibronectin type III domain-containing protein, partial [Candidatus Omnitrophica bacterium]|nr:fibronectin type III domain-containing protein [Candidatus Omnitrophota bacterium]